MAWADDYHENYIYYDDIEELEEHCAWLKFFNHKGARYKKYWALIKECAEYFGCKNISVYSHQYLDHGDGLDELSMGFWINLKEIDFYNLEGAVDFDNFSTYIDNGFMFVRNCVNWYEKYGKYI